MAEKCEQLVSLHEGAALKLCSRNAPYRLRGLRMCAEHYIEALEHGGHLDFGQWDGKDDKQWLIEEVAGKAICKG